MSHGMRSATRRLFSCVIRVTMRVLSHLFGSGIKRRFTESRCARCSSRRASRTESREGRLERGAQVFRRDGNADRLAMSTRRLGGEPRRPTPPACEPVRGTAADLGTRRVKVVAIGASTGGPQALSIVLAELPADTEAAVVAVQHMADGFIEGLADGKEIVTLAKQVAAFATNQTNQ